MRIAAMLHDIGKVTLPDRILQKPDSLDAREYEEVKRHPEEGAELINRVEGMSMIADWVRHSHEHYDGSGYPDGLAGEAIPLASRILLVADAYDAITSDRRTAPRSRRPMRWSSCVARRSPVRPALRGRLKVRHGLRSVWPRTPRFRGRRRLGASADDRNQRHGLSRRH